MKNWFRLLRFTGKEKGLLPLVVLLSLGGNICLLTVPRLIGRAIDCMLPGNTAELVSVCLTMLTLYLLGSVLQYASFLCAAHTAAKTVQRLRNALFAKLHRLPVKVFDTRSRGDLMARFGSDTDAIADGLQQGIQQLISGALAVVISLIFMLSLSPAVALVAVLTTPLCFLVGFFITRYGSKKFAQQAKVQGNLSGCAEEMISGMRTVQAFGYEKEACERFDDVNRELYDCGTRAQFASALVNPSTRFVNNVAYVLVGIGGIFAGLSAGMVASFLSYTAQFAKPFNEITSVTMQLQMASAAMKRIFEVLDEEELTPEGRCPLPGGGQEIRFDHVSFSYSPDRPLIRDFTLTVPPGTTVAIVGATGSGKTTLVNLLMRFYEPDTGHITVGGVDTRDIARDELRSAFGMVLQDTWLFEGTVKENIAYGNPQASDEQIAAAARAAHAHGFIQRLPKGYDTLIREGTGEISAGQKQLLTIARTMLLDAPMLILDEATSSVDILTEQRTQKAFRRMMRGKTAFIIAHRLSTVRDADVILVLEDGNVAEQGTHEDLLRRKGAYWRLYRAQFEAPPLP